MNAAEPSTFVLHDADIGADVAARVGGKALALARMQRAGLAVPPFATVTVDAYRAFLDAGQLRERILFEIHRKAFADMRWEEMWDAALRIRNLFATVDMPHELAEVLTEEVDRRFAGAATAVRSSAPGEDSATASFAGLHESYINIRGTAAILEHVKLVWASLWSDGALLYRRELGLDPLQSSMAVVIQEIVVGERSGVAFSADPANTDRALIEAVHGLNQGLVDGTVEPDRWTLDRVSGAILEHHEAKRLEAMVPGPHGVSLVSLPESRQRRPPLAAGEVLRVHRLARAAEDHFGSPQDVEWTLQEERLFTLQARPITTLRNPDARSTYLALRRSFESLQALRRRIEDEALPAMTREADGFAETDPASLDQEALLAEIECRKLSHDHWVDVYTLDFIPFAHGARLFGQAYNDALHPDDPYEFADLLAATPLLSTRRNQALAAIADMIRAGDETGLDDALDAFVSDYGSQTGDPQAERDVLIQVARRLARAPLAETPRRPTTAALEERYLTAFPEAEQEHARALLDLGRASWRLRDDDNIYLGRIEAQLRAALAEARRRGIDIGDRYEPRHVSLPSPLAAGEPSEEPEATPATVEPTAVRTQVRQIVGQPAGPGLGVGTARVVAGRDDVLAFQPGEILVCDAIDPNMTFIVPLAAGIVERRGGMLIHGAIIAREYGLPCVTGVPQATSLIHSGDRVTVDGYLGIVIVG